MSCPEAFFLLNFFVIAMYMYVADSNNLFTFYRSLPFKWGLNHDSMYYFIILLILCNNISTHLVESVIATSAKIYWSGCAPIILFFILNSCKNGYTCMCFICIIEYYDSGLVVYGRNRLLLIFKMMNTFHETLTDEIIQSVFRKTHLLLN